MIQIWISWLWFCFSVWSVPSMFHAELSVKKKKKRRKCTQNLSVSPPPEQIRCCRSRCEALQFPAHAPKPWRQETALYWGKTHLSQPSLPPSHPCSLTPWSHPYLHLLYLVTFHPCPCSESYHLHSKSVQTQGKRDSSEAVQIVFFLTKACSPWMHSSRDFLILWQKASAWKQLSISCLKSSPEISATQSSTFLNIFLHCHDILLIL